MIKFTKFLEEKQVWDKPVPAGASKGKLSPSQKAKAKARARSAGRPYPNMVDNIWAARTEEINLPRLGSNPGKFKRLVARHLGAKAASKIDGGDGSRIMAKAKKSGNTDLYRKGSFIKNFYGEENVLEARRSRRIPAGDRLLKQIGEYERRAKPQPEQPKKQDNKPVKEEKAHGKPFRTPGGPKKFSVYVKNEKGNTVKVNFGDPNLSIKRDNPKRRKSFRARHNCANPGPRTKARYWSCRQWRAGAKVEA